jgi:hypothetical protein
MSSATSLDLPNLGIALPSTKLIADALKYAHENTPEGIWNHTVRCAFFATILANRLPQFSEVDLEVVVLGCILHDLGLVPKEGLSSKELRFEVDGAEIARRWLRIQPTYTQGETNNISGPSWDRHREQLVWDTIALHTTCSIALHKEPEVALTHMSIFTDFIGTKMPGITAEEFREVVRSFPRANFDARGVKVIMCGLCESKPETTYDNFVGQFGQHYGYDGEGCGKEDFQQKMGNSSVAGLLVGALEDTAAFLEAEDGNKKALNYGLSY